MNIPFNSLSAQLAPMQDQLQDAARRVVDSGWYLMGPEARGFEKEFAAWLGTGFCVSLNSGTDALHLALKALGCGPGDEVVMPSFTALPCYHAVLAAGCVPVFAEVEEDYFTLDPESAAAMITPRTKAVMAVHLYGQTCDMDALAEICSPNGPALLEDCAQSHGATFKGRLAGTMGDLAAFSFYPTKNLGALGDAGAVAGNNPDLEKKLRLLSQYGEQSRYVSVTCGVNSRMDEIQAAFLRVRLEHLDQGNQDRRELAAIYDRGLAGLPVRTPALRPDCEHVHHLYVIRAEKRDELAAFLKERGIGTAIHYPVPGHRQQLFESGAAKSLAGNLKRTETLCGEILSLPMYPGLTRGNALAVCQAMREFYS